LIAFASTLACGSSAVFAKDEFFNSNGVRLRYVQQGTGEAVVLLHGQGGWIEEMWGESGVIDALAKRYHVIALDQRGYGQSDKPHDPSAYGAAMGDDVIRLLDHLRIQRAHIIGYSMGARVTSWLVVNKPNRLLSATLGGSTYYVDTPEERRTFEVQAKEAESDVIDPERVKRNNPGMTDVQVAEFIRKFKAMMDPLAVAANYRGTPGLFITETALSASKVPLFHIIGSLDTTRLAASRHLKDEVLPSTEFLVVEGATHASLPRRKEFVDAVDKFLARHPADVSAK